LRGCKTNNKVSSSDEVFRFYIDGGFDTVHLEHNHTQTLFYLAQIYTSLKQNEKAIEYCAMTMKRQLETGEFEPKDWAINCINLGEYFIENNHLCQAEYSLFAGIALINQ
jgi:hypothetical protein